jgi:hypothetical protein
MKWREWLPEDLGLILWLLVELLLLFWLIIGIGPYYC